MSTILKALKKLEHELPDARDGSPGGLKSTTRQTLGRRARRSMLFHKSFWIMIGLVALAAVAWVIYFPVFSDSRKSAATPVSDKADKILKKTASQRPPAKNRSDQSKDLHADRPITVSRSQNKSVKKKVSRKAATSVKRTKTLKSTQPHRSPSNPDAKPLSVKPLEDDKLKLQAISWSQNPDSRIAVINGSIMREGESIEGFRIIQIGQDDVVVRSGQDERKLVFGFK